MKTLFTPLCLSIFLLTNAGLAQACSDHPNNQNMSAPHLIENIADTASSGHNAHTNHHSHGANEDQTYTAKELVFVTPHSQATISNARVAGGYLTITNNSKEDDRLLSASSDRAKKVEIHVMSMEGDVMKMRKLNEPLTIAAGESVTLAPTGFHIMFMDLLKPFKEGETIDVELEFEHAGKVNIPFHVNPVSHSAKPSNGHSHH